MLVWDLNPLSEEICTKAKSQADDEHSVITTILSTIAKFISTEDLFTVDLEITDNDIALEIYVDYDIDRDEKGVLYDFSVKIDRFGLYISDQKIVDFNREIDLDKIWSNLSQEDKETYCQYIGNVAINKESLSYEKRDKFFKDIGIDE